jgi:hypothetical protein
MSTATHEPERRKRVFLHIGSPKTGTTFLQQVLWAQHDLAAQQGVLLPLKRFNDHYQASLDIRGMAKPNTAHHAAQGMWSRLVADAGRWKGTVLISHELFSAADDAQARRALDSFGPGVEIHVVLTARDLLRQLTAEWQEHVKHRSTLRFDEFVATVRKDEPERSGWFWRVQDYERLVRRWGASLPAGRVHVVTVPPSGSPPNLLWQRFAGLLGLDPDSFDTGASRANTSLGIEQAEILRRVNQELGDRLALPGPYPVTVKDVFAHQVLAGRPGTRLTLDADDAEFALEQSRLQAEGLAAAGVDVVGSLDELVPTEAAAAAPAGAHTYDPPGDDVLLRESLAALADVLVKLSETTERNREAVHLAETLRREPVRAALMELGERHPALLRARDTVQRLRARL